MSKVVLYELNEVPWKVIDMYVERRPRSNVARLVAHAESLTTRNLEPIELSPWCTWPTFHTGLHREKHNSHQLGQDPATFHGPNIWDVAEAAGKRIGLFGVLQSWPAREFKHGGFYVPDTFAQSPTTFPATLEGFQRFNLSMTNELGFSPDQPLGVSQLARAGLDMLARGLTPWSAAQLVRQLTRERRENRYKAARSIMQVLPAFDLYWRRHRRDQPDLSIFFTNHVAGMMHRFWGDTFADYSAEFGYEADPVFGGFVLESMDIFDHQLGRIMKYTDHHTDTVLVVAASMGQGPIPYDHIDETYVIEDHEKLVQALGVGPAEKAMAMYPLNALQFSSPEAAQRAGELFELIQMDGSPFVTEIGPFGSSLTFRIPMAFNQTTLPRNVTYRASTGGPPIQARLEDLGFGTAKRLGGGNTAYHVPEGIYMTYGSRIQSDQSRDVFDVREASTRIMEHMGIADAWAEMRGAEQNEARGA